MHHHLSLPGQEMLLQLQRTGYVGVISSAHYAKFLCAKIGGTSKLVASLADKKLTSK